jgi:hypothetical protein
MDPDHQRLAVLPADDPDDTVIFPGPAAAAAGPAAPATPAPMPARQSARARTKRSLIAVCI